MGMPVIEAVRGDITTESTDAIVNAANSSLLGGGGVDGAIHAAAGPRLLEECRRVRRTAYRDGLPVGEAVATSAGDLPCRWVIHTVGPNWHRGQRDPGQLASCYRRSIEVAAEIDATSVAFPAVSAGVYGWDRDVAAGIAVDAVRAALPGTGVVLVRFILFSDVLEQAFLTALARPSASTTQAAHTPPR